MSSLPILWRAVRCSLLAIAFIAILGHQLPSTVYAAAVPESVDHARWDHMVASYVTADGKVAYMRLAEEARGDLDWYLAEIAAADPSGLPPEEQIAFWINAYNAGVVAGILAGYSPESTLGRARFFRWYTFKVAGEERTLDSIEHEILRKRFSEPRIHFALVCAATSCPKLRREAYIGARLDQQLDDQGRQFVNDPQRNRIDATHGQVRLSRIFQWFAEDFIKASGSVAEFIARYLADPGQAEALRNAPDSIEYLEYDWTMNASPGQRPD
jgi:hypothetical protein